MSRVTGPTSAVAIFSGGLDSTTMVYDALNRGFDIKHLVTFDYGQKHRKEVDYAGHTADRLNLHHSVINLWSSGLTDALSASKSSLINPNVPVPEGHYTAETMKATVVPNRNMIMLAIAGGIAVAEKANTVLMGVHSGDHAIYPDCRPHFIEQAEHALFAGNLGFGAFSPHKAITAPYLHETKAFIARQAFLLGVPLESTWSCYNGGEKHCGRCGTCVERLEAVHEALSVLNNGMFEDRTQYMDNTYWRTAVRY